jgi:hypothetical protein
MTTFGIVLLLASGGIMLSLTWKRTLIPIARHILAPLRIKRDTVGTWAGAGIIIGLGCVILGALHISIAEFLFFGGLLGAMCGAFVGSVKYRRGMTGIAMIGAIIGLIKIFTTADIWQPPTAGQLATITGFALGCPTVELYEAYDTRVKTGGDAEVADSGCEWLDYGTQVTVVGPAGVMGRYTEVTRDGQNYFMRTEALSQGDAAKNVTPIRLPKRAVPNEYADMCGVPVGCPTIEQIRSYDARDEDSGSSADPYPSGCEYIDDRAPVFILNIDSLTKFALVRTTDGRSYYTHADAICRKPKE